MINQDEIKSFMNKVKEMEKSEKLDLSSDEDLSIAVMNLISIEEHLFFSGGKTGKTHYYEVLEKVRNMRKELLKLLVKDYEGEIWCISKHLLSASMRLMEVGTKHQSKGEHDKANEMFKKSYDLYNLFWGLNLGMMKKDDLAKDAGVDVKDLPVALEKDDLFGKLSGIVGKLLNCCKE